MTTNSDGHICCPKCASTNLQAIADTHAKGVSGCKICLCGPFGLCGAGKATTDHYWICQDCGNKFKM